MEFLKILMPPLIKGDKWKKARAMMSGVFTSGRLKFMTPYIVKCSENMEGHLAQIEKNNESFEARDLASIFTLDAFASAGKANYDNYAVLEGKIFVPTHYYVVGNARKATLFLIILPVLLNKFLKKILSPFMNFL